MKITKEQLPSKETQKRGMQWFNNEPVEKFYDGKVKVRITEQEYNAILTACSYVGKGYIDFVQQTIQTFNDVKELIKPETEEEPQDWLTLSFDKEAKEPLVRAADKARMTVEDFVRALVWTRVKHVFKQEEEREIKRQEQLRKQSFKAVTIRLQEELIQKFEKKYGKITSITDVENKLQELLYKELG